VIIKKKINQLLFLNQIKKIISKLIFLIGIISFLLIILLITHYLNSGMYQRFKPGAMVKKIDTVILDKYLGFSIFEIEDYVKIKFISIKHILVKNKFEDVNIKIDQKNLYNLELQRKNKIKGSSKDFESFSKAVLRNNKKNYNIKLRVKGDRALHWYDKDQTSYKIDLIGKNRIWGLEEFSVQKPITRNYIYEFIFHKLLESNELISLKYFFVNLSLNDNKQGIYAVEEGFSKELIERNKKRNGPIFGLDETLGVDYPSVEYDLYSKKFWMNNHPQLINNALSKLNNLKQKKTNVNEIFDLEKWATFFAVIDLSHMLHGSLSKSVKLYYNPVTAKFEPIGFDGHYNSNLFKDFLILDFMDSDNRNCSYICSDREWYLRLLKNNDGSNNIEFLDLYINALTKISSENFINEFEKNNLKKIEFYNSQLLSEISKKDVNYYKGIGLYIFNKNFLLERSKYIQNRLLELANVKNLQINSNENQVKTLDLLKNDNVEYLNGEYYLTKNLIIKNNYYLPKNKKLNIKEGIKIIFKEDVSLISEGSIFFNGTKEKPIIIYGEDKNGSFVLLNNDYSFNNVIFKNLSFPKNKNKILYGGINIINSNVAIIDTEIANSNSEDAINIISSHSYIKNLSMNNISADAIDIDFGDLVFENITCKNILNDCLDISGAHIQGKYLEAINVMDKGLSFGENSVGIISNVNFIKNKLGIAVKDGSELSLSKYILKKNKYDIAVFNKKEEYGESILNLNELENEKNLNILLGKNNTILSNSNKKITKVKNNYINSLFY
jgi:hypothetical protein